jgi:6-phosphogluconolactonase
LGLKPLLRKHLKNLTLFSKNFFVFHFLANQIDYIFATAEEPISFMLTGGRSAEQLYRYLVTSTDFLSYSKGAIFYFGDERCVPPDHPDSNYNMVMGSLFANGVSEGTLIKRMEVEKYPISKAAMEYEALLPAQVDILLLSVGEDGHIASLFPHQPSLKESVRRVIPVTSPKIPYDRLTITPPVIHSARHVFVMALGDAKVKVYEKAKSDECNIDALPAKMVLDRIWITD